MSNDEEDTQQPSIRPPPSAPQLTDAQEKLRKLNNKLNQLTLRDGAEKIRTDSTQSITSLAQATGRSVGQVKLVVGVMSQVKKSRGANSYNAWAAEEMVNANSNLKEGERKWTIPSYKAAFTESIYKKLSQEAKDDYRTELASRKVAPMPLSKRKVGMAAQANITSGWNMMRNIAKGLYDRTGHEVLMFAAKSSHDSYARPAFFVSKGAEEFLETTFKLTPPELAHTFEAWTVNGNARGVANQSTKAYNVLKNEVSDRLGLLLRAVSDHPNPQVKFENFFTHMVAGLGVDLVGWPFKNAMRNTSNMKRVELRTLHKLLHQSPPSIYWIKLSEEEVRTLVAERQASQENGETIPPYVPSRDALVSPPPPTISYDSGVAVMPSKRKRNTTDDSAAIAVVDDEEVPGMELDNEMPLDDEPPRQEDEDMAIESIATAVTIAATLTPAVASLVVSAVAALASLNITPPSPPTIAATTAQPLTTITRPSLPAGHPSIVAPHATVAASTTTNKENVSAEAATTQAGVKKTVTGSNKSSKVVKVAKLTILAPGGISNTASEPVIALAVTSVVSGASSVVAGGRTRGLPVRFKDNGIDDVESSETEQREEDDASEEEARPKKKKKTPGKGAIAATKVPSAAKKAANASKTKRILIKKPPGTKPSTSSKANDKSAASGSSS